MIVKSLHTNSGDAIHRGFNNKNILIDTGISATFHSKSNGRNKDCELQRSSDSSKLLEIMDGFQGDLVRPISTFSGGESFIVSLSLALGLSNLASQKISIDSLFLDDGFGALDSDSLELALNALNQLQSSGKMVGVISHEEVLKERIPLQIRVMPKGDGASGLDLS